MVPRGVSDKIIAKLVYTGRCGRRCTKGQAIGNLQVWRGDAKVLEVPVQAARAMSAAGTVSPARLRCRSELVINCFVSRKRI